MRTKQIGCPRSGVPGDRSSALGWRSGVPGDRFSPLGWRSGVLGDRSSSLGWRSLVFGDLGIHEPHGAQAPSAPPQMATCSAGLQTGCRAGVPARTRSSPCERIASVCPTAGGRQIPYKIPVCTAFTVQKNTPKPRLPRRNPPIPPLPGRRNPPIRRPTGLRKRRGIFRCFCPFRRPPGRRKQAHITYKVTSPRSLSTVH